WSNRLRYVSDNGVCFSPNTAAMSANVALASSRSCGPRRRTCISPLSSTTCMIERGSLLRRATPLHVRKAGLLFAARDKCQEQGIGDDAGEGGGALLLFIRAACLMTPFTRFLRARSNAANAKRALGSSRKHRVN